MSRELGDSRSVSVGQTVDAELAVVSDQIARIRDIVIDAVAKLGDGFTQISNESRNQQILLETTLQTVDVREDDASPIAQFIGTSRQLTGTMLFGLEQISQRTVDLAAKLEAMLPVLSNLSELSRCIRDSANQVRYLAMNATLEAGRAGPAGQGFAVVASAVKELALEFNEVSSRMDDNVESVRTVFSGVAAQAKSSVEIDAALATDARSQAAQLELQSQGLNEELSKQLHAAQNMGRSIQRGVHLCIQGLQFGDLIGQLCQLSTTRLDTIRPLVAGTFQWASVEVNQTPALAGLFEAFERSRAAGVATVQQKSLETGDIELF